MFFRWALPRVFRVCMPFKQNCLLFALLPNALSLLPELVLPALSAGMVLEVLLWLQKQQQGRILHPFIVPARCFVSDTVPYCRCTRRRMGDEEIGWMGENVERPWTRQQKRKRERTTGRNRNRNWVGAHTHTRTHKHTHTQTRIHIHTVIHTHTHTYVLMYLHIHAPAHTYNHISIWIRTNTYTNTNTAGSAAYCERLCKRFIESKKATHRCTKWRILKWCCANVVCNVQFLWGTFPFVRARLRQEREGLHRPPAVFQSTLNQLARITLKLYLPELATQFASTFAPYPVALCVYVHVCVHA